METGPEKLYKIIKIGVSIFAIIFFSFLIYSIFFSDGIDFLGIIYIVGSILVIGFTAFIVIYGVRIGKEYNKNLMSSKPKKRFTYLDSFYYVKTFASDNTSNRELIVYHVIQDTDSKKIYAIGQSGTNVSFQKVFNNTKLLRNDNMDGFSTRKDWKEVNYGDVGSFWIDKELIDCCQIDGEKIIISYFGKNRIKVNEMRHRNSDYDISLLTKAIFIIGYVEFDSK